DAGARRRPDPPLLTGAPGRDVQVARALPVGGREEFHQGTMLTPRVGALVDRGLARHAVLTVEPLESHHAPAVAPGGEAVLGLRLLDDVATGEPARHGSSQHEWGGGGARPSPPTGHVARPS